MSQFKIDTADGLAVITLVDVDEELVIRTFAKLKFGSLNHHVVSENIKDESGSMVMNSPECARWAAVVLKTSAGFQEFEMR